MVKSWAVRISTLAGILLYSLLMLAIARPGADMNAQLCAAPYCEAYPAAGGGFSTGRWPRPAMPDYCNHVIHRLGRH